MPAILLPLLLLLAACASPAPGYFNATRHDITLQGIDFAVFHKDNSAEVIRLGYLTRRERDVVPELMVQAAEKTTGCRVIPNSLRSRIPGDTGEARVALRCDGG